MQAGEDDGYGWFVGIDWATDAHEVCILTPSREPVTQRKVEHNGPAIAGFIDQLMRLCEGKAACVAIAIEIPRGAVVESLVERGFHVYAINPKQLDQFRDRHTVAGAARAPFDDRALDTGRGRRALGVHRKHEGAAKRIRLGAGVVRTGRYPRPRVVRPGPRASSCR